MPRMCEYKPGRGVLTQSSIAWTVVDLLLSAMACIALLQHQILARADTVALVPTSNRPERGDPGSCAVHSRVSRQGGIPDERQYGENKHIYKFTF